MLTSRENLTLIGHQEARNLFLQAYHSARFPHGWIISGAFGIGKATFACHMARYLLSGRLDGNTQFAENDPLHRRMMAGSHGDLWTISPEDGKEIGVDAIRNLNSALNQTPAEGGWRVVIIDGADSLNRNAANALLKRLEEPPVKTLFFLITSLPGRLLPTIRSRCQCLHFNSLTDDEVKQVLQAQGLSVPDTLASFDGSAGRAMRLMAGEGAQLYTDLQAVLNGGSPTAFIHAYGGDDFYEQVEDLVRQFVHAQLLKNAGSDSVEKALKLHEEVDSLFTQARVGQLDRKATLTCVFASLHFNQVSSQRDKL